MSALTAASFRLEATPTRVGLLSHPVWGSYTEPSDADSIVGWGVDRAWLDDQLSSFEGFAEGYTHPMVPVLDLSMAEQFSKVVFATDFFLVNGRDAFGFLSGTHAVGIFVGESLEILNRNLPGLSAETARRLSTHFGAPIFPLKYAVRTDGSPAGTTGTIEAWW